MALYLDTGQWPSYSESTAGDFFYGAAFRDLRGGLLTGHGHLEGLNGRVTGSKP